jgi:Kef-type K+ transport system membrane component KefB
MLSLILILLCIGLSHLVAYLFRNKLTSDQYHSTMMTLTHLTMLVYMCMVIALTHWIYKDISK